MTEKDLGAPAARSATCLSAAEAAGRLLRWIMENAYNTPIDDARIALGAVWMAFCFDHDLNPFAELDEIAASGFPFKEALGCDVPEWMASKASEPKAPPEKET